MEQDEKLSTEEVVNTTPVEKVEEIVNATPVEKVKKVETEKEEDKTDLIKKIVIISLLSFLIISVIIGLVAIKSNRSLNKQIETDRANAIELIETYKSESLGAVNNSRSEVMERIDTNVNDIFEMKNELSSVNENVMDLATRLDKAGLAAIEKIINDTKKQDKESLNDEKEKAKEKAKAKIKKETEKIVEEPIEESAKKKALWKRVIQFWNWF